MRIASILLLTTALSVASAVFIGARPRAAPTLAFRVVVNAKNPVISVDRKFLEDAYLKTITRWSSGEMIRPVDLGPGSPARSQFSQEILRRTVAAVKSYWQQMIFSGRDLPPPQVDTDELVVRYVVKHEDALGYVSDGAALDGVKILSLLRMHPTGADWPRECKPKKERFLPDDDCGELAPFVMPASRIAWDVGRRDQGVYTTMAVQ